VNLTSMTASLVSVDTAGLGHYSATLASLALKPSGQCTRAANTARGVLGQVTRAFHYRDRHVFIQLYKQYVRPNLEFAAPARSPWLVGDIKALEDVQIQAVKMVSGLKSKDYHERLAELGIPTWRRGEER
jgi:hypothetical protein